MAVHNVHVVVDTATKKRKEATGLTWSEIIEKGITMSEPAPEPIAGKGNGIITVSE